MPWTAAPDRGFTTGEPWLPFGDASINVADQDQDPASLLSLYRRLLWYRKGSDALRFGDYRPVELAADQVLAYQREADGDRLLILLNFGDEPVSLTLPEGLAPAAIVLSTRAHRAAATT